MPLSGGPGAGSPTAAPSPSTNYPAPPWVSTVLIGINAPINWATTTALEFMAQFEGGLGNEQAPYISGPGNPANNPLNVIAPPGNVDIGGPGGNGGFPVQGYANLIPDGTNATISFLNQSNMAAVRKAFQGASGNASGLQSIASALAGAPNAVDATLINGYLQNGGAGPVAPYSSGATNNYSAATSTGAGGTSAAATSTGCNASGGWHIDLHITSYGLSGCQLKALKGGILTGLGGALMLVGGALIVVSGLAGKGPLAPVVAGAQSVLTGAKKLPGVGQSVPSGNGGPPSEASVTASDQRVISRERNRQEKAMSTPKIDKPNYQGGRPRRRTAQEDADRAEQPF